MECDASDTETGPEFEVLASECRALRLCELQDVLVAGSASVIIRKRKKDPTPLGRLETVMLIIFYSLLLRKLIKMSVFMKLKNG
jgi:hypothetical protein